MKPRNKSSSISQKLDRRHPTTYASHSVTRGPRYLANWPGSETQEFSKPAERPRRCATHSAPTTRQIDPIPSYSSYVTSISSRQRCRDWHDAGTSRLVRNPPQFPQECGASVRAKSIPQWWVRRRGISPEVFSPQPHSVPLLAVTSRVLRGVIY